MTGERREAEDKSDLIKTGVAPALRQSMPTHAFAIATWGAWPLL